MNWRAPQPVVCWERAEASNILPVEAEAVPAHLFQTTHVPLQLDRVDPTAVLKIIESSETEDAILGYVQQRVRNRATDVIPVLGDSGAGKSHLVRWLRNALKDDPIEKCRVVFVPKHRTSLRGVVELILDSFEDEPELDPVRERLLEATDLTFDEKGLRTRLRDELCFGLEHEAERTQVADAERGALEYLGTALPALLRDAHFSPRYLSEDGAIAKLVHEKLVGRAGDEAVESAYEFRPEDIAVSTDDVTAAAETAQDAARTLLQNPVAGGERTTQQLAAAMLNDQLPAALKRVFGIGGEDLKDLFISIRRVLRDREDVLLLVEDFAMFQGLQRGLLDAITTHSTEAEQLCHLVTVFAVTTGYYSQSLPDTLHTRCSAAFVVGEQSEQAPTAFAASYLRAIRLGIDEVERRHLAGPSDSSCEGCPVIEECHEGFGSYEGEGLFPFTATMLSRATDAALKEGANSRRGLDPRSGFNPRLFLNHVMRPVLVDDRAAIVERHFPSIEFAQRFNASRHDPGGDVLVRLEQEDEGPRRVRLALMYGNPVSDGDLPTAVHDAFSLPPLGRVARACQTCGQSPCQCGTSICVRCGKSPCQCPRDQKVPPLVAALDEWRRSGRLPQKDRLNVRRLVTEAVLARINFNDGGYRPNVWTDTHAPFVHIGTGNRRLYNSVVLDGDGSAPKGAVQLDLSWQQSEDVDAVQSLAWLEAVGGWRDVPGGIERAARLEPVLDRWSQTLVDALGLNAGISDELVAVTEALELAQAVAGRRAEGIVDRLALILADLPEGVELDPRVTSAHAILLTELRRRLGYARGATGAVAAIDLRRGQRLLRRTKGGANVASGDWSKGRKVRTVEDALGEIRSLCAELSGAHDKLAALLPDLDALGDDEPESLARHIAGVCKGRAPTELLKELRRAARNTDLDDVASCRRTADDLSAWSDLDTVRQAQLAHGDWRSSADRLGRFIRAAEEVLAVATPTGTVLGASEQTQVIDAWHSALTDTDAVLALWKRVAT